MISTYYLFLKQFKCERQDKDRKMRQGKKAERRTEMGIKKGGKEKGQEIESYEK